jgi:predicted mannosyl-3-phosphoglycerate phosphatase (HAD superfamily)
MGLGSYVVVVDKVLPDEITGTDKSNAELSSAMSLGMYILFKAQERREGHWRRLLTSAGLQVKEVRRITHFDAIIIAKKQS